MRISPITRISAALGAGAALAIAAPLAASAHVTIDPATAEPGSYATITVKVPNESATATTTRVELGLPEDTPFTSVRYVPVAGWSAELVRETLPEPATVNDTEVTEAVTSIVWTADAGSEIADGELQLFTVSLGAVPEVGSLALPAIQYYSDGTQVEWTGLEADADKPSPILYVEDEAPSDSHGSHAAGHNDEESDDSVDDTTDAAATSSGSGSDDTLARVFGLGGLVLGAAALVLAVTARRRNAA
jgi:uncharacterized protein YcnI